MNKISHNNQLSIHIKGFQSLEDLNLEIKGVTAIVGDSDKGKSAVVRAIYAVANNSATDSMISWGATALSIEVKRGNNTLIYLRKKGSSSTYTINGVLYKNLGGTTPKEVYDILGVEPIVLSDGSKVFLSVQHQFAPLPILTDSSSVVDQLLSGLGSSEIIAEAIKKAESELQSTKSDIKMYTTRLGVVSEVLQTKEPMKKISEIKSFVELAMSKLSSDTLSFRRMEALEIRYNRVARESRELNEEVTRLTDVLHKLTVIKNLSLLTKSLKVERAPFDMLLSGKSRNSLNTSKEKKNIQNFCESKEVLDNLVRLRNKMDKAVSNRDNLENFVRRKNWLKGEQQTTGKLIELDTSTIAEGKLALGKLSQLENLASRKDSILSLRKAAIEKIESYEATLSKLPVEKICPLIKGPYEKPCLIKLGKST